jgi:hypothetical protein
MTARELFHAIRQAIAEECSCSAAWDQHPGKMTPHEVGNVEARVGLLLREAHARAVRWRQEQFQGARRSA